MLFYLPRKSIRFEYVSVTPEGFRFRKQMFESLNSLLKWFKEHFNDPIPRTPSALTPHSNHSARNTPYNPQTPMLGKLSSFDWIFQRRRSLIVYLHACVLWLPQF